MDKFAIIKVSGRQYKVMAGDEISVDKIEGKKDAHLSLNEVLLYTDAKAIKVGQPQVKDAQVKAKILEQLKGKKIRVATYKAKSRYRRVIGFRPLLTKLKIEKIIG